MRSAPSSQPLISVCIVTGRRLAMLDAVLACLAAQEGAPPFEVLVGSDGDPDVRATVLARFAGARVCELDRALPGAARNLLVDEARGRLLVFLDDDITFDAHLLARYARLAADRPDVGVFGGPNDTPPSSTRFQFVQGAVLASLVGSGPVRRRYGAHPAGTAGDQAFILCNLAVRREVMVRFPDDFLCAEENAVLTDLRHREVAMYYDPALVVYHERRPTVRGFAQQMHKYGRGRGLLLRREPSSFRPWYAAPSALLAYLAVLPVLLGTTGPWAFAPLVAYAGVVLAGAVRIARTLRRSDALPLAAVLLVVLHACYGAGVLRGLLAPVPAPVPLEGRWTPVRPDPVGARHEEAGGGVVDLRDHVLAPDAGRPEPSVADGRG